MDPFALIIVSLLGALVLWLLLLGRYYPGSGAETINWRPTRSVDVEVELEMRDVAEMLEAQNRRRRARGQPELTEEAIEQRVVNDRRDLAARRDDYLADQDLDELLEAANLRRRKRGRHELTIDQLRAEVAERSPGAGGGGSLGSAAEGAAGADGASSGAWPA